MLRLSEGFFPKNSEVESDDLFEKIGEKANVLKRKVDEAGALARESLRRLSYLMVSVFYFMSVVFVLYLIAAPILLNSEKQNLRDLGAFAYIFAAVTYMCHQLPERSFMLLKTPLPVCARDVGIFVGSVVGVLAPASSGKMTAKLNKIIIFLVAFIPIGVDGISQSMAGVRESSNLLRFATGFFFGFGVLGYFTSKIFSRHPDLRDYVTRRESLTIALTATILFTYVLFEGIQSSVKIGYVGAEKATEIALKDVGYWGGARAYYIAPRTPLSLQVDRFIDDYDDFVLKDVRDMPWAKEEFESLTQRKKPPAERHIFGLWTVVMPDDGRESSGRFVYSNAPGDYVYVDAWTGEVIEKRRH